MNHQPCPSCQIFAARTIPMLTSLQRDCMECPRCGHVLTGVELALGLTSVSVPGPAIGSSTPNPRGRRDLTRTRFAFHNEI